MLVLEDLHWSDRSTRDLLAFLVRNLRAERIVLVATYRSDELYRGHPLRPFLAELDRGRRAAGSTCARSTARSWPSTSEAVLGARPERTVVESVFERSQGNAFFAEELVTIRARARRELPPMLRDILLVRIESRSAAAQELLRVAAARRRARARAAAGGGLAAVRARSATRRCARPSSSACSVPAGADVYAFRHALLREAVYQELLPGERNRLHAACGAALAASRSWPAERTRPPPISPITGTRPTICRARWPRRSRPAGWPSSARASRRPARTTSARSSCGSAWRTPRPAPGLDLVALTLRAAEVANLAGDHGRAAALIRGALAEAGEPTGAGLLWERLGRFLWAAGDSVTALEAYEEAVRLVPAAPPSAARARVLAARGQGLMLLSRHQESRACCEEAIAIARAVGARGRGGPRAQHARLRPRVPRRPGGGGRAPRQARARSPRRWATSTTSRAPT